MPDFSRRSHEAELMDDPAVSYDEFRQCLRELRRINVATLAYRPTLCWLKRRLDEADGAAVTLFDIGSGGGDMMQVIRRWAKKRSHPLRMVGIDVSPWAKRAAESLWPDDASISHETANIFSLEPERRADFIISSLFTHHLDDAALRGFIEWMERHATRGWLINDLHRHVIPYFVIKWMTRVLPFCRLVRHDAAVSVARAFTGKDWRSILAESNIPPSRYRIRWYFPFRYAVECRP